MQDRRREETKIARGPWNIERACECERLARVDRFGAGQFFEIALDQVGDAQKDARSIRRRRARPIAECFFRCGNGPLDIAPVAVGHLRLRFTRRWLDIVEIFSANWLDKLPADEVWNSVGFGSHAT